MALTRVRAGQIIGLTGQFPVKINSIIPAFLTPNTTAEITINGAFFTPNTSITIGGTTVNSLNFVTDNQVKLFITTGAVDGSYNVIANNGIESIFTNVWDISTGIIFSPTAEDWVNRTGQLTVTEDGLLKLKTLGTRGIADWLNPIDVTKDFEMWFKLRYSPLNPSNTTTYRNNDRFILKDVVTNEVIISVEPERLFAKTEWRFSGGDFDFNISVAVNEPTNSNIRYSLIQSTLKLKYIDGVFALYSNNEASPLYTFLDRQNLTNNLYLRASVKYFDTDVIKYVERI